MCDRKWYLDKELIVGVCVWLFLVLLFWWQFTSLDKAMRDYTKSVDDFGNELQRVIIESKQLMELMKEEEPF